MTKAELSPFEVEGISFSPHPTAKGMVQARARYRREDGGPLLGIYGKGKSESAATRDLKGNLKRKREAYWGGSSRIDSQALVEKVAEVWLTEKRSQHPPLATRTIGEYERWINAYIKGTAYGKLKILAASKPVRAEEHLRAIANGTHKSDTNGGGEGAMRSARKVMHGIMSTAWRHGAIPTEPKYRLQRRTVEDARRRVDTERAFTVQELRNIQKVADESKADLGDLVAFMSALGPRISEALTNTFWRDVELEAGTVLIRGTKTANSERLVHMPPWLTKRLEERADLHGTRGLVFGVTRFYSKLGQARGIANVEHQLRKVLDEAGVEWAGSHTFRRTVATMLDDRGFGIGAIAAVLGQDPKTTSTYIKRQKVGMAAATFADPF